MQNNIFVNGIETNNLKNIDIEIIRGAINLIIGPSGSGKSTLAYETVAQIGQHEYMSMFADDVNEPTYKVRSFHNMIPAVPIKQSNHNNNSRSSIGTYFGISRKIGLIYSVLFELSDDYFVLNKEENVCERCHGLGTVSVLDANKIVNYNLPIKNIPFRCWNRYKDFFSQILCDYCVDCGIDVEKTFRELSDKEKKTLLYGESTKKYSEKYKKVGRIASRTSKYYGVMLNHDMMPGCSIGSGFYSDIECECCNGRKYNAEHQQYKLEGLSIGEFLTTRFDELLPIIEKIDNTVKEPRLQFAISIVSGFVKKAVELKLGHLCFNRSIPTLSGGELQRLRMVQVFNTQLSDLLLVLDEPLAGLSKYERPVIRKNVIELAKNNTILIVDHGTEFLDIAKNIICLGEAGGSKGGRIIDSKQYLKKQQSLPLYKAPTIDKCIRIKTGSIVYQYSGADVSIATGRMNLITGESGIGKSTLLREYFPQILDDYVYINQKPMLGSKNSSVATAMDVFDRISTAFGKKNQKDKKNFSNLTGSAGCCSKCGGAGYIEFGEKSSPKIRIECSECQGTGFTADLKRYKLEGKTIFDVWNMTIEDASIFFEKIDNKVAEQFRTAETVKLGHLKLGQPTASLSGGENIRIKMLKLFRSTADIMGIDEPFKGLNNEEKYSIGLFLDQLRQRGKTLVVIDHAEDIESFFSKHIELKIVDGKIIEKK